MCKTIDSAEFALQKPLHEATIEEAAVVLVLYQSLKESPAAKIAEGMKTLKDKKIWNS
jgi:hypothetical protein